jgi:hypothetical protein
MVIGERSVAAVVRVVLFLQAPRGAADYGLGRVRVDAQDLLGVRLGVVRCSRNDRLALLAAEELGVSVGRPCGRPRGARRGWGRAGDGVAGAGFAVVSTDAQWRRCPVWLVTVTAIIPG